MKKRKRRRKRTASDAESEDERRQHQSAQSNQTGQSSQQINRMPSTQPAPAFSGGPVHQAPDPYAHAHASPEVTPPGEPVVPGYHSPETEAETRDHHIQRALAGTGTNPDAVPDTVLEVLGDGGKSLGQPIQRALEERMDADFSNVRIHTSAKAAEAADAIDAKAFACGNDIVFNAGEYDPESGEGQFLLAHELAHVRQQTGAAISMMPQEGADLEIDPDPQLEREADEAAEQALSGDGPLTVNRMGADVHIQRTALGELNPFSGNDDRDGGELVLDEVEATPEALAEEVRQIKTNQAKLFNAVNAERSMTDRVGEAAGAGVVGGTAGLAVSAVTANPVLGALAGGAVSDVGKTLYGKLWGKGRDTIANAEIPDVSLDQLSGVTQSVEKLIDEKLRQRFGGKDTGLKSEETDF
ncbi:hypothetical protein C482_13720 [Natrialba chahannaoensis JCM 10990]|uniref:eCIS core domain-containing protein n=1 Tax=Natrialba chahannaoensis JCM 10990 TaxID=1227492 RepID=M0AFX9_9EURY|nr:DUF4157 domain-containing protein [Natrialba chahannaoensis]ELY97296.1 hypothetical protein C482_13720 [Natrialba chahannaoensis JCM 10990]